MSAAYASDFARSSSPSLAIAAMSVAADSPASRLIVAASCRASARICSASSSAALITPVDAAAELGMALPAIRNFRRLGTQSLVKLL